MVLNFFKRHKNVYVAFLGSQYTGDGRGGGGRVGEESDLRTSIAAGGGGGDAIPSSSRPGRRSSPSTSSGHPAAFAGYETSLRTPQGKTRETFWMYRQRTSSLSVWDTEQP